MNNTEYQKRPIFKYDQKERVVSFNIVGLYLGVFLFIIDLLVMILGFFGPMIVGGDPFLADDYTLELYRLRASFGALGLVEYYHYLCLAYPGSLIFGSTLYGIIRAIWIHKATKKDKDAFNF